MTEYTPPYLIHCEAGIDRTGFLSIILEAFMGAPLKDIARDYMLSLVDINEYSANDSKNGRSFVANLFSEINAGPLDTNADLRILAAKYLEEKIGLKSGEMKDLADKLNGGLYEL
jgi:protein tyrosine/serine phosphatase